MPGRALLPNPLVVVVRGGGLRGAHADTGMAGEKVAKGQDAAEQSAALTPLDVAAEAFSLVLVAPNKCELRYYGKMTEASYGGGMPVPSDRKGVIHLDSKNNACKISRNTSTGYHGTSSRATNVRFDIVAPRLFGTHQGVTSDSVASSSSLHRYALRASNSNEAWRWFTVLRAFLAGDDSGGLDDSDLSDSSDSDTPAVPQRKMITTDNDAAATQRAAREAAEESCEEQPRSCGPIHSRSFSAHTSLRLCSVSRSLCTVPRRK